MYLLGDENGEPQWPDLIFPETYELVQRCMIVKTQGYRYADFTGVPGPPPTDWLKETQMGLEEIAAYQSRVQAYWMKHPESD